MAYQFRVFVEVKEEVEPTEKYGIEDKIADALRELGYTVIQVKLTW